MHRLLSIDREYVQHGRSSSCLYNLVVQAVDVDLAMTKRRGNDLMAI